MRVALPGLDGDRWDHILMLKATVSPDFWRGPFASCAVLLCNLRLRFIFGLLLLCLCVGQASGVLLVHMLLEQRVKAGRLLGALTDEIPEQLAGFLTYANTYTIALRINESFVDQVLLDAL